PQQQHLSSAPQKPKELSPQVSPSFDSFEPQPCLEDEEISWFSMLGLQTAAESGDPSFFTDTGGAMEWLMDTTSTNSTTGGSDESGGEGTTRSSVGESENAGL